MTMYVGNRYVPKPIGTWDSTKNTEYESLSIVTWGGNSFTSKKPVPTGIDITNESYWVKTGDFNLQLKNVDDQNKIITQNMQTLANDVDDLSDQVDIFGDQLDEVSQATFSSQGSKVIRSTTAAAINSDIQTYTTDGYKIVFPYVTIEIDSTILIPNNAHIDFNGATIKRKSGSVFDMIKNKTEGNATPCNIILENLVVDGNRSADNLDGSQVTHMFSGINFVNVWGVYIRNVEVMNTVNNENNVAVTAGGILLDTCINSNIYNSNVHDNIGTGIYTIGGTRNTIDYSTSYNNTWSGISGFNYTYYRFNNLISYNNGASNISINGLHSLVNNVLSSGAGYSGLNVGHTAANCSSSHSIINNVKSYNNQYEGLTITASDYVSANNISVFGNAINTTRENIRLYTTNYSKLNNIISYSCTTSGIRYYGGVGHTLDNSEFNTCNTGIYADTGTSLTLSSSVKSHHNTNDGIALVGATSCNIMGAEFTNNARYGILISGGSGHVISKPVLLNNTTDNIFESGSPTNISYDYNQADKPQVRFGQTGVAYVNYIKNSVADEVNINLFSCSMALNGRAVVDYVVTCYYPASSIATCGGYRNVSTIARASGGTVTYNNATAVASNTASAGSTQTISTAISADTANNLFYLQVNQNNETLDGAVTVMVTATIYYFVGTTPTRPVINLV